MHPQSYRFFTRIRQYCAKLWMKKGWVMEITAQGPKPLSGPDTLRDAALRVAAQKLEASFLAEMLKSAGLGAPRESFGGGAGEDQFSSFLVTAQAEEMVKSGGIGLAEHLFNVLKARADAA